VYTALFLSSIASGFIATLVMTVFLYLPLLWNGVYYDTFGGLGGLMFGRVDSRTRFLGALLLLFGGVVFAFFYGWFALMFLQGTFLAPNYSLLPGFPNGLNLFYPLLGAVGGMGQGIFVALVTTFIVTDFHPVGSYRDPFPLILSYIIGNTIYGTLVMFFHSQLLPLLLNQFGA
jgi:hypothetical protein